jgi:hypothetical protein
MSQSNEPVILMMFRPIVLKTILSSSRGNNLTERPYHSNKFSFNARGHRPSGLPIATVSQASVRVSPYLEVYRHSRKRCHHRSSSGTIRRERSPNFLMTTTNKLNKFVTPVVIVRQASPIATVSRPQSGSPPYLEAFGTIN